MKTPLVVAALVLLAVIPGSTPQAGGTGRHAFTLIVGQMDEMKTRNLLPDSASDTWTQDVLERVYDRPLKVLPNGTVLAYLAKGVDVDGDGIFEDSEYDRWAKESPDILDVVVYYDFNGVEWHDGTPTTVWDVLFSYHVAAQSARFNSNLRVLYCTALETATYESCGRQLNVEVFDLDGDSSNGYQKNWQNEGGIPGDPSRRIAIRYALNQPFARFYESTLLPVMIPMHVWSRTGGGRHASSDFGCAVWIPLTEAADRGIPACGNTDPTKWGHGIGSAESVLGSSPYQYTRAQEWSLQDADVIGNGPFVFDTWIPGIEAKVVRYERYYTGVDPDDPSIVYDAEVARILKKPTIDGIRFKVFSTMQLGVFALQNGDIDYFHWNVGADFVGDLLKIPEIAVEANPDIGFTYMAYNLRRTPWGYVNGDPAQGDVGIGFRDAVSHLVDKKSIVQNLLGNFGVIGHGVISPANTFWYNDNIPKPDYNLSAARAVLDDLASSTDGGRFYVPGYSTDPPGTCVRDFPSESRGIGSRGTAVFEILTPQADYDPRLSRVGWDLAADMRAVGINAISLPMPFGEIEDRINAREFDLYILDWRIRETYPDHLFSFFHSSNAGPGGQNHPGYRNATFDDLITRSRAEMDRDARQLLIFEAQRQIALDRPYEVFYFATNVEGYRKDRFVNWTVSAGTIWNEWSLLGVRPPRVHEAPRVSARFDSAIRGGEGMLVIAEVSTPDGVPVASATVEFSVSHGNLTLGGRTGPTVVGTTDAMGRVSAVFNAPPVASQTAVLVRLNASHPQYLESAVLTGSIQVFPSAVRFLSIALDLPLGDLGNPGVTLPLLLSVRDQDRNARADAFVRLNSSDPALLRPDPTNGTASDVGSVLLVIEEEVKGEATVRLTARATRSGYADAEQAVFVSIRPPPATLECPGGEVAADFADCPRGGVTWVMIGALSAAGIAGGIAIVLARRRKRLA